MPEAKTHQAVGNCFAPGFAMPVAGDAIGGGDEPQFMHAVESEQLGVFRYFDSCGKINGHGYGGGSYIGLADAVKVVDGESGIKSSEITRHFACFAGNIFVGLCGDGIDKQRYTLRRSKCGGSEESEQQEIFSHGDVNAGMML